MNDQDKPSHISLRDWVAGQILAGRVARYGIYGQWNNRWMEVAEWCYVGADAMLEARKRKAGKK